MFSDTSLDKFSTICAYFIRDLPSCLLIIWPQFWPQIMTLSLFASCHGVMLVLALPSASSLGNVTFYFGNRPIEHYSLDLF